MCLVGLTTAEGKETALPLAIGGVMGGVILLLLLLTIVLIILVLVSCQAVRKTAKDKMNDSEHTSNHFVGFNG